MKIALLNETNDITQVGSLTEIFPNTSFPDVGFDFDFLQDNKARIIKENRYYNQTTQKQVECVPYFENGEVYSVEVLEKSPEDLAYDLELEGISVRFQRNELLKDSDWTQVADAPVDKTAWAIYRQALRDITQQEGFPFNVVFPNPPL